MVTYNISLWIEGTWVVMEQRGKVRWVPGSWAGRNSSENAHGLVESVLSFSADLLFSEPFKFSDICGWSQQPHCPLKTEKNKKVRRAM